jgi:hypothetical protein
MGKPYAEILQEINSRFPDNNTQQIDPADVRLVTKDLLDYPLGYEVSDSFYSISEANNPRIVKVNNDETNGGEKTFYLHDGNVLNWLVTQDI